MHIGISSVEIYGSETVCVQHYNDSVLCCMIRIPDLIDPFDITCLDGLLEKSAGSNCTQDPADQCVANGSCANNETCTCVCVCWGGGMILYDLLLPLLRGLMH